MAEPPTFRTRGLRRRLQAGDTYGLVLILILVGYALMAFLENTRWAALVLSTTIGATLLLSLYASHARGRLIRAAVVVTVLCVILSLITAVTGSREPFAALAGSAMFVFVFMAPIAITARIVQHPVVNLETILGAVCAYLLIGMLFAGLYRAADAMNGEAFFAQTDDPSPVQYLYFSFITLTTVGFGDLTAATDGGRVMVTFEALLGQVFLVTVVAGLISSYGRRRRPPPSHDTSSDADDDPAP